MRDGCARHRPVSRPDARTGRQRTGGRWTAGAGPARPHVRPLPGSPVVHRCVSAWTLTPPTPQPAAPAPRGSGPRPGQEGSWDCQLRPPSEVARSTARPAASVPTTQPRVALAKLADRAVDKVAPGRSGSRRSLLPWLISTAPVALAGGVGLSRNARWGSITENGPG